MSDVQFDEERISNFSSYQSQNSNPPKIVALVIKLGLADSEKKANYILLGLIIIVFVISIFVFFNYVKSPVKGPPVNEQTIQQMIFVSPKAK